jgi:nucleoid-associated protein YgaU
MSTLSISRMVVPFVAIGAVAVVTVVLADRYVHLQPSDDRAIVAAAPAPVASAASQPVAKNQDPAPGKLAAVQAETDRLAATLNAPKPPDQDAGAPEFDVASIQPTGEAVIAGRAAPGATVELLRNGEPHDRTVADKDGQFVMIPQALPPGTYDLTLRSKQPDGKEATSKQRVAVTVEPSANQQTKVASAKPNEPAVVLSSPPASTPGTSPGATVLAKNEATAALKTPSGSTNTAAVRPPRLAAAEAAVLPGQAPPGNGIAAKTATVSRGDSLWRISQRALGAGARYSVLYKANRDRIHNADLIYPGQIFILPAR